MQMHAHAQQKTKRQKVVTQASACTKLPSTFKASALMTASGGSRRWDDHATAACECHSSPLHPPSHTQQRAHLCPSPSSSLLFITFNPSHAGLSSAQMIRCPQRSKSTSRLICSDHVQSQKRCTISPSVSLSFCSSLMDFIFEGIKCDLPVLAAPTLVQQYPPPLHLSPRHLPPPPAG